MNIYTTLFVILNLYSYLIFVLIYHVLYSWCYRNYLIQSFYHFYIELVSCHEILFFYITCIILHFCLIRKTKLEKYLGLGYFYLCIKTQNIRNMLKIERNIVYILHRIEENARYSISNRFPMFIICIINSLYLKLLNQFRIQIFNICIAQSFIYFIFLQQLFISQYLLFLYTLFEIHVVFLIFL